jgi:hypothetical protein
MRSFLGMQLLFISVAFYTEAYRESQGFAQLPFVNRGPNNRRINSLDAVSRTAITDAQNRDTRDQSPNDDCEARFAMEYGVERQFVRNAEHAYLSQEEEDKLMMLAPASNSRIVPMKYVGLAYSDFSIA